MEERILSSDIGSQSSLEGSFDPIPIPTGTGTKRQWIAGIVASLGMWGLGSALGWSSPSVPQLEDGDGIDKLSKNEISWVASVVMLAAMPGCFLGGYAADKMGRKMTCIIAVFPFALGFGLIAGAQNAWQLIVGRIITGMAGGTYTVTAAVFCAEISNDKLRSRLASCTVVSLCLGIIYTYCLGAIFHWRVNSIISGATPLILLIGMLFLPETPRFLVTRGKLDKASKALKWYRGANSDNDIQPEFDKLVKDIRDSQQSNNENEVTEKIFVGSTIKPVLISFVCCVFQQLCGTTAVTFYSVDIFDAAGGDIHPNICAIIYGTTQAVCTAFAGVLLPRFGRRPLFLFSQVGMCVSLATLGLFYYIQENKFDAAQHLGWLPLVSLMAFTITYCCGAGIIPWALVVDLCPPHVKGPAAALCTGTLCGLGFGIGLAFPSLLDGIHGYGAFWLFSALCALGAVFVALFVPETKDKTMDEIQSLFRKPNGGSSRDPE